MTRALFLSPHNDDETLFGAFSIQREQAHVVVVLRSCAQAIHWPKVTCEVREAETEAAIAELGVTWEQLPHPDVHVDWEAVRSSLEQLRDREPWRVVFAPANELGGNVHHNEVGMIAREVFGEHVVRYLTYTDHRARSMNGTGVEVEPQWIAPKLRALACYRSQIDLLSTRHHFLLGGLREWVAP